MKESCLKYFGFSVVELTIFVLLFYYYPMVGIGLYTTIMLFSLVILVKMRNNESLVKSELKYPYNLVKSSWTVVLLLAVFWPICYISILYTAVVMLFQK